MPIGVRAPGAWRCDGVRGAEVRTRRGINRAAVPGYRASRGVAPGGYVEARDGRAWASARMAAAAAASASRRASSC